MLQRADGSGQMGALLLSYCFIAPAFSLVIVPSLLNMHRDRKGGKEQSVVLDCCCSPGGLQVEQSGGFSSEVSAARSSLCSGLIFISKKTLSFILTIIAKV